MKKIPTLIFLFTFSIASAQSLVKFAAIGDYGKAGSNELAVSNLVKSWSPEFIITLGDNNYELGEQSTIDANIGQYYRQFIYPYVGGYGSGDTVNRFFPSLGNHDWYTASAMAYLNYFTLPGNERYYDFVKGNIHFFAIDSDPNEPSGVDSNSIQALWLKNSLANSQQDFNIVYFHHAAYSSSEHGNSVYMQWPFKKWGASAVMAGHDHSYERIFLDSMLYFVNGLGGKSIYSFVNIVPGSQVRYNSNYGAMLINSYNDSMVFKFYSVSGSLRDNYKILTTPKTLSLTALIQGFYDATSNSMVGDMVNIYLRNISSPYNIIDSAKRFLNSSGNGTFSFSNADNATNYYLVIKHRNALETWSSTGSKFIINNMNYNFSSAQTQAYGNNQILKGTRYCVYSGDVTHDGIIDVADLVQVYNSSINFSSGYIPDDVNGDLFTDAEDLTIVYNNLLNSIVLIRP